MGLDIYFQRVGGDKEELGYLRKCNIVYAYCEDNIGIFENEEFGEHAILNDEDLTDLNLTCQDVLGRGRKLLEEGRLDELEELGESVLPTCEGFFFGSTEYNEDYIGQVEETMKEIIKVKQQIGEGEKVIVGFSW